MYAEMCSGSVALSSWRVTLRSPSVRGAAGIGGSSAISGPAGIWAKYASASPRT